MAPDPSADIALVICSDRGLFWQGAFPLSRAAMLDPGQRMDLCYYVAEPMPAPYFNSGVLLANGPRCRAEGISSRAIALRAAHPAVCHYGDPSGLNATRAGRWLGLSPGWNWPANMRCDLLIPARTRGACMSSGRSSPGRQAAPIRRALCGGDARPAADVRV